MTAAEQVHFPTGTTASLVAAEAGDGPEPVLAALGLTAMRDRPVIVLCGGAGSAGAADAGDSVAPAVAAAARRTGASVVDGGTGSGVMAAMGRARAALPAGVPVLLGVAPAGAVELPGHPDGDGERVSLEPNHTHFALADAPAFGGETWLLVHLAEALGGDAPVVMVVAGGGDITALEVVEATRRGWPVFVLADSGGAASRLAALWRRHREPQLRPLAAVRPPGRRSGPPAPVGEIEDLVLREIIRTGDLRLHVSTDPGMLCGRLAWELQRDPALHAAWARFAAYDVLATQLRRTFERFQLAILILGVLATLLALIYEATRWSPLHWIVIAVPIAVSVLIAFTTRRAVGKRWILLRGAAESIKSRIYRYRAGVAPYDDPATRREHLTSSVKDVVDGLMRTAANAGPLPAYDGVLPPAMYGSSASDDGLSPLGADEYLEWRVGSQLEYFHGRVRRLDRRRSQLQLLSVSAGGAGAILAAANQEIWVGLTTTIAAAALSYLGYMQADNAIITYNQTSTRLELLRDHWRSLPAAARTPEEQHNVVRRAERILSVELGGWVEQMTQAMDDLQAEQARTAETEDHGRPEGRPLRRANARREPRPKAAGE